MLQRNFSSGAIKLLQKESGQAVTGRSGKSAPSATSKNHVKETSAPNPSKAANSGTPKEASVSFHNYSLLKSNMKNINGIMGLKMETILPVNTGSTLARRLEDVSKNLKGQFDLCKNTAVLLRKSTLELIRMLQNADSEKKTLILDGSKGVGKSSTILNVVYHFSLLNQANDERKWIIFYVPSLSSWMSGKYEYESTKNQTYIQPTLAAQVLHDFVFLNENILSKMPSPDLKYKSLAAFVRAGADDLKKSHPVLMKLLDHLTSLSDPASPKVLMALDQVNALYRNSNYHDSKSNLITADRFELSRKVLGILSSSSLSNVVRLGATDCSYTQIKSEYLESLLRAAPVVHKDPLDLNSSMAKDILESVSEFGVILPSEIGSENSDGTSESIKIHNLQRFVVPVFDMTETKSILEYYKRANIIHSKVSESNVVRTWMLSQGNPLDIFKSAVL